MGIFNKDGEIESVSIDGVKTFTIEDRFPKDVNIIITYHTFKEDKVEDLKDEEQVKQTKEEMVKEKPIEKEEHIEKKLTVKNSKELAGLLKVGDPGDKKVKQFANKYLGYTIEFNGSIHYLANYNDYSTRYDILFFAGKYNKNSQKGPNFKVENINPILIDSDFDNLKVGLNGTIAARIIEYDDFSELFKIELISFNKR